MSEKLNIFQRINAVMKEVDYVKKDTSVGGGGGSAYKAVSHDNVIAVLRPHLVSNGIVIVTEQEKGTIEVKRDKAAGIAMLLYSASYKVSFVNMDNPEDRFSVTIESHAADNGDKAPGKAISYAVKYAMLKTFCIETGEHEEGRYHEEPEEVIQYVSDIQLKTFDDTIKDNNVSLDAVLKAAGVPSLTFVRAERFDAAIEWIRKQGNKNNG